MAYEKKTYNKPYKKSGKTEKAPAYKPKRGPLSKLMSEEEKSKAGIHELNYDFACRITRLFQYLTEDALVVHGSRSNCGSRFMVHGEIMVHGERFTVQD